jgi:hypothetical protein
MTVLFKKLDENKKNAKNNITIFVHNPRPSIYRYVMLLDGEFPRLPPAYPA